MNKAAIKFEANADLTHRFNVTRQQSENLCAPLNVEDYIPQAFEFASPPKWHLAHTSWFFEEMILVPGVEGYCRFDEDFSTLFNSYYLGLGTPAKRAHRGVITRPTVAEVYAYRQHVTKLVCELLQNCSEASLLELVELGINHEQQHQELLLTDLKLNLSLNPKFPTYSEGLDFEHQMNRVSGWLTIPAALYQVGAMPEGFCFDNEKSRHSVYLNEFSISKSLITNKEWLEFIDDGGYTRFDLWLDEGWNWLQNESIKSPLYWIRDQNEWMHFTLSGLQPLNPEAMVAHISYYEADAFARWSGARLPTEFEWEAAAPKLEWGKRWEWTSSAYQAYPRFAIGEGAVGEYNGKFMANQYVLRGASVATPANHSRMSYRNFFHPFQQWQYSGLRLAK